MFLENIFSVYFLLLKGAATFRSMIFKADFSLSNFRIISMYYYLINLSTPQWGIVASLNRLAVVTNVSYHTAGASPCLTDWSWPH